MIMKINFCRIKYWQSLISSAEGGCKRWEADQDGAGFTINHPLQRGRSSKLLSSNEVIAMSV